MELVDDENPLAYSTAMKGFIVETSGACAIILFIPSILQSLNKLECFSSHSHLSLIFVVRSWANPSVAHYGTPSIDLKYYTTVKVTARDKHTS